MMCSPDSTEELCHRTRMLRRRHKAFRFRVKLRRTAGALAKAVALSLVLAVAASCSRAVAPPVVAAARYPEYVFPTLSPPDPKQAEFLRQHEGAWRWFQAGDLTRAETGFQAVLKQAPQFYPSEAALGYVSLARKSRDAAQERFDRVLQSRAEYVPALVGRGEALLAQSREIDALAAFESAVRLDPTLVAIGRRVEVLRARAAQETVAAAQRAAQANRLDEAAGLYEQAIAASPDSAFLIRELADVEAKQGKTDQALERYRRAIELEPSDTPSRIRVGEILDARGDLEGALKMYTEASGLEPSAELRRRMAALEARLAYLRLPSEYRAIPDSPSITRGDLASLIGLRLAPLLSRAPAQGVVITDARNHWASAWIMAAATAGVLEPYENHTFQPRTAITRADLAQAVSRLLKILAVGHAALLKDWQSRQQKMSDVGVSNLHYADASLSVTAGILPLADGGLFQLSRSVSGAEAIEAITRIERLFNSAK
ncbi:MAG: tetratricopeptide repeat protein [Acidobacteria bacterium]|nr:tetratricopeptide repeat protein [Acidobacteriota bacterium]